MNSSSSSSWLSFGSKTQTLGCISLFLQRFLCSRSSSSSTYPSDQITEFDFEQPGYTGNHRRVNSSVEYVELQDENFFILSFENDTNHEQEKRRERRENQRETEKSRPLQTQIEGKKNNKNALLGREALGMGELKLRRKEKAKKRRKRRENIQKEAEKTQTLQAQTECEENNKNDSNAFSGRETLEIGELKLRRKEKRKKRRKRRESIQKETEKSQPLQTQPEFKVNNKNASSGHETLKAVSPKKRQNTTDKFLSKELSYGESKDRDLVNCEEEEECGSSQDLSPVSVLDFGG